MAKTRRQKEQRRKLSAKATAEKQTADFEFTKLKIPEGVSVFSVKEAGKKRLEVIPYLVGKGNPDADEGDLYFMRTFYDHTKIGPNNDRYVCPAMTCNLPCPICEDRDKMKKSENADKDLIKELYPKKRQLWNVFDHDEPDKGVQPWDSSFHLFGKILFAEIRNADEDDEYEYFADEDDGLTVRVAFAKESFAGNAFYKAETVSFKARREPLPQELFDSAHCLDDLLIVLPYEKLSALYHGEPIDNHQEPKPDTDDDWDDKPKPKKKATKKKKQTKKAPKPQPVPDDDDDWDENQDQESEPQDDDWDDWDDDDNDDDWD